VNLQENRISNFRDVGIKFAAKDLLMILAAKLVSIGAIPSEDA